MGHVRACPLRGMLSQRFQNNKFFCNGLIGGQIPDGFTNIWGFGF